jgi:hypothetical protein
MRYADPYGGAMFSPPERSRSGEALFDFTSRVKGVAIEVTVGAYLYTDGDISIGSIALQNGEVDMTDKLFHIIEESLLASESFAERVWEECEG